MIPTTSRLGRYLALTHRAARGREGDDVLRGQLLLNPPKDVVQLADLFGEESATAGSIGNLFEIFNQGIGGGAHGWCRVGRDDDLQTRLSIVGDGDGRRRGDVT